MTCSSFHHTHREEKKPWARRAQQKSRKRTGEKPSSWWWGPFDRILPPGRRSARAFYFPAARGPPRRLPLPHADSWTTRQLARVPHPGVLAGSFLIGSRQRTTTVKPQPLRVRKVPRVSGVTMTWWSRVFPWPSCQWYCVARGRSVLG